MIQYYRNLRDLQQRIAYEELVKVDFMNMRSDLAERACDRLRKLAPGATLYHMEAAGVMSVAIGPVKDFGAFASAIDFGDVVLSERFKTAPLPINVHRMKLGARAETIRKKFQRRHRREGRADAAGEGRTNGPCPRRGREAGSRQDQGRIGRRSERSGLLRPTGRNGRVRRLLQAGEGREGALANVSIASDTPSKERRSPRRSSNWPRTIAPR